MGLGVLSLGVGGGRCTSTGTVELFSIRSPQTEVYRELDQCLERLLDYPVVFLVLQS